MKNSKSEIAATSIVPSWTMSGDDMNLDAATAREWLSGNKRIQNEVRHDARALRRASGREVRIVIPRTELEVL